MKLALIYPALEVHAAGCADIARVLRSGWSHNRCTADSTETFDSREELDATLRGSTGDDIGADDCDFMPCTRTTDPKEETMAKTRKPRLSPAKARTAKANRDYSAATKAERAKKGQTVDVALFPLCLCGCGGRVIRARRRFIQGHDQRLRGNLQRIHRGGKAKAADLDLDTIIAHVAMVTGQRATPATAVAVARIVGGQDWVDSLALPASSKAKAAPLQPDATRPREATRKVGRWVKKGLIDGTAFVYIDAKGTPVRIELSKTKEV